ncbi:hypothetical protein CYMTET_28346 [Cymbomonas tetramitiformis]|uniref:Uncharacterized protein n=1 Tax=Cymbomonas tetramitiformis TaxID=36881 RepID=A0AAE0FN19_9CHLO|nr:hypothetical protein CYMTET_28346 [Cymbomonas tetramitiformis]
MRVSSHATPPLGAHNRIRLETRSSPATLAGTRYRPTPLSPAAILAAADRTRATAVQNSTWDTDLVKRVAKDALGAKNATFSGSENDRNALWTSLVKSIQYAFEQKESSTDVLFDLVTLPLRQAKRQLLSALDKDFSKEVSTPLRLDVELDKVDIEDIYAHILEVWERVNPSPRGRVKQAPPTGYDR